jgi:formate dehydrogenase alpha subunit
MDTVHLTIDDRAIEVAKGETILEAGRGLGIEIPTICWHPNLTAPSLCRMCVVEQEGARVLVPACTREAEDGMVIRTTSERVMRTRKLLCELLESTVDLSKAPELGRYAELYGAESGRYDVTRREARVYDDNPTYVRDYDKCLMCWRCVQACGTDAQHTFAIARAGRGFDSHIATFFDVPIPESTCVYCGNCVGVCPTGALEGKRLLQIGRTATEGTGNGLTRTRTTCSYCGVGCQIEMNVQDGRVVGVTSQPDVAPNNGSLCVKGRFGYDYVDSPKRLTTPLIRKNGEFAEASWDEALDLVARRLGDIKAEHGPDAIAAFSSAKCTNEENYLMQKLLRAVVGTNNVDHCSRLCHAASVAALNMSIGSAAMSNSMNETIDADCILVTGSNTTEAHPVASLDIKAAARERGARLIVVDPRRIEIADFATLWLRQRPGTDVVVFTAMCKVILDEALVDWNFVEERTENLEALVEALEDFSLEEAERISGVPAEDIATAARWYANAERAMIFWGMGISQSSHGVDNALSLINLAMLAGHLGKRSTGLNPLRGQNNVQGASDMGVLPNVFTTYQKTDDEEIVQKFERAWGAHLTRVPGMVATEIVPAAAEGRVKAMLIMGENPMMSEPDLHHTEKALRNLEFLCAIDIFMNETGEIADVVLPAASLAEKDGTTTNTDRRVQRIRKAVEPPGQARADWRVLADLATRMGYPMNYNHPREIFDEMRTVTPGYAGINYERIEQQGIQWPCPTEDHEGTPYLYADGFPRGLGKFFPLEYRPPVELPDEEYPYVLSTGRILYHWHGGTISRESPSLAGIYPKGVVEIHPEDGLKLGLESGDWMKVASRRGEVVAEAKLTDRSPLGVVFISFHWKEAAANILTINELDPVAKIPEYKYCAVNVQKVAAAEGGRGQVIRRSKGER